MSHDRKIFNSLYNFLTYSPPSSSPPPAKISSLLLHLLSYKHRVEWNQTFSQQYFTGYDTLFLEFFAPIHVRLRKISPIGI